MACLFSEAVHGNGQMGYGLCRLFRSVARAVMPMVKSGTKALGNIALNAAANVLGDVASGKNLKTFIKNRGKEAVNVAKEKAVNRLTTFAQTGCGKKRKRSTSAKRSTSVNQSLKKQKTSKRKPTNQKPKKRRTTKRRKASTPVTKIHSTKKRRTPPDIFG